MIENEMEILINCFTIDEELPIKILKFFRITSMRKLEPTNENKTFNENQNKREKILMDAILKLQKNEP